MPKIIKVLPPGFLSLPKPLSTINLLQTWRKIETWMYFRKIYLVNLWYIIYATKCNFTTVSLHCLKKKGFIQIFPLAYRHSISLGKLQNSAFVVLFDQTLNNTRSLRNYQIPLISRSLHPLLLWTLKTLAFTKLCLHPASFWENADMSLQNHFWRKEKYNINTKTKTSFAWCLIFRTSFNFSDSSPRIASSSKNLPCVHNTSVFVECW